MSILTSANVSLLCKAIQRLGCQSRLVVAQGAKVISPEWEWPLFQPEVSYVELSRFGPVSISSVIAIQLRCEVTKHIGKLVPPKTINVREQLEADLIAAGITYTIDEGVIDIRPERDVQKDGYA